MIYLFDEARERQKGYLWNAERFDEYASAIKPIYNFEEYRLIKREVFSPGNIILYHESFSLNQSAQHDKDSIQIINDLSTYAKENGLLVAYFSGSEQDRRLDDDIAHLPVSYLYDNLECFIKHVENNETDLKYLLYGENFEIEREISELLNEEISKVDYSVYDSLNKTDKSIFVINTFDEYKLTANVDESFKETIFSDDVSDKELDGYVKDWLNNREYDAIIIPLCFGNSLSDFNGLRLATHIRCTDTINRLKPIFLFGIRRHELMLSSPYYDILKTKDVSIVGYDFRKIEETIDGYCGTLSENELPIEMGKMNIPNHEDGHSVANEWAINRWALALNAEDEEISKIVKKVQSNIYFKYLNTIYPAPKIKEIPESKLKFKLTIPQDSKYYYKPKILLVDDEAEKGWYEIFCKINYDINNCDFYHLDDEFNDKSQEEIINIVKKEIIEKDINVVILDFRIHPSDKYETDIKKITGYKILLEIKNNINAGIQVVILSATNKVWNLLSLQKANADSFILKERPSDKDTIGNVTISINRIINSLSHCCNRLYLKEFYRDKLLIDERLEKEKTKRYDGNVKTQLKKQLLVTEIKTWFDLSCDILKKDSSEQNLIASFIYSFSVIECYANSIISMWPKEVKDEVDGKLITRYTWNFKDGSSLIDYTSEDNCILTTDKRTIPWSQKIINTLNYKSVGSTPCDMTRIDELVLIRHSIIHPNISDSYSSSREIDITALIDVHRLAVSILNTK